MTLLRPKVNPSDVFLTGETTKYVRADGQMAAAADSVARATGATNTANIATNTTNIATNTTNIATNTSSIADHETRITALEGATSSNLLASNFSASTVTGTTSLTSLGTLTLPANSVAVPGECLFRAWGTWTTTSATFNHSGPRFSLLFDSADIGTMAVGNPPIGDNAQDWPWEVICRLVNSTSTANQEVYTTFSIFGDGYLSDAGATVGIGSPVRIHGFSYYTTLAKDTTANKNFELKVTPSSSGDHCTRNAFLLSTTVS